MVIYRPNDGIKFPDNRLARGRYLGPSYDTGSTLTHVIRCPNGKRIIRSSVLADDGRVPITVTTPTNQGEDTGARLPRDPLMSPGMGNESIDQPTDQGEVPGTSTIQDPFEYLTRVNDSKGRVTVLENIEGAELDLEKDHPGGDTGNIPSEPLISDKRPASILLVDEFPREIVMTDEVEMEEGELDAGEINLFTESSAPTSRKVSVMDSLIWESHNETMRVGTVTKDRLHITPGTSAKRLIEISFMSDDIPNKTVTFEEYLLLVKESDLAIANSDDKSWGLIRILDWKEYPSNTKKAAACIMLLVLWEDESSTWEYWDVMVIEDEPDPTIANFVINKLRGADHQQLSRIVKSKLKWAETQMK